MGGKGEFCRVVTNEVHAFLSFFLMGQTQSPKGPRVLAHKLKPLASPDSGPQATTVFNAAVIHSLSIIKHLKLSCMLFFFFLKKIRMKRLKLVTEYKQDLPSYKVTTILWIRAKNNIIEIYCVSREIKPSCFSHSRFRGFNQFSGLLLKHKPTICVALCQDRWQTFS